MAKNHDGRRKCHETSNPTDKHGEEMKQPILAKATEKGLKMKTWLINIISLGIVPLIGAIAKARRDKREQEARLKRWTKNDRETKK